MKKHMLWIALFAIAGVACADIIDDFESGSVTYVSGAGGLGNEDTNYDIEEYVSGTWVKSSNNANHWTVKTSGGQGDNGGFVETLHGTQGALVKVWTDNKASTGTWTISFWMKVDNAKNNGSINVGVVGTESPWHTKTYADHIVLNTTTTDINGVIPADPADPNRLGTILGETGPIDVSSNFGWIKYSMDIDLGTGYDQLAFVITGNGDGSDVGIDNIAFPLTPPQSDPATIFIIR